MPWSDFRTEPEAEWMSQTFSPQQWIELNPARQLLFRIPGVTIWTVWADWMHTKYIGTDQYLFGSILWLIVYKLLPGIRLCMMAIT